MSATNSNAYLALGAVGLTLLLLKSTRRSVNLPPGPKPFPILGNIRDFALKEMWIPATQWAAEFGA
jgi:hypothetical protein